MAKKKNQTRISRFEQKLRAKKRAALFSLLKSLSIILLIFIVIAVIIWFLFCSPFFKVTNVKLSGEKQKYHTFVDSDELKKSVNDVVNKMPSILLFDNIKFRKEVEQIHGVRSAQVAKEYPSKILVSIEPRKPLAQIRGQIVDIDGIDLAPISSVSDEEAEKYPEVKLEDESPKIDALLLLNALLKEDMDIDHIEARTNEDLTLVQKSGMHIIFGNITEFTLKLEEARQILDSEIVKGKKIIDVSSAKMATTR